MVRLALVITAGLMLTACSDGRYKMTEAGGTVFMVDAQSGESWVYLNGRWNLIAGGPAKP